MRQKRAYKLLKRLGKSSASDVSVLGDETADVVSRVSALSVLASDKRLDLEPEIAGLLSHPAPALRAEALLVLLARWNKPSYLADALQMLHRDPSWQARTDAALTLVWFAQGNPQEKDRLLRELTRCLMQDEDVSVQQVCYEGIIDLLAPADLPEVPDFFDRERDVDRELIRPYLPGGRAAGARDMAKKRHVEEKSLNAEEKSPKKTS